MKAAGAFEGLPRECGYLVSGFVGACLLIWIVRTVRRDASGLTRLFTQFFGAPDKRKPERQQAIKVRLLERP